MFVCIFKSDVFDCIFLPLCGLNNYHTAPRGTGGCRVAVRAQVKVGRLRSQKSSVTHSGLRSSLRKNEKGRMETGGGGLWIHVCILMETLPAGN